MARFPSLALLSWSLATFSTAIFVLPILYLAYSGGSLGSTLAELSTVAGLAIFGLLWIAILISTRSAVIRSFLDTEESARKPRPANDPLPDIGSELISQAALAGAKLGAVPGALLSAGIVTAVFLAPTASESGNSIGGVTLLETVLIIFFAFVVFAFFAIVVGYGIGCFVAVLFALVGVTLLAIAERLIGPLELDPKEPSLHGC